MAEALLNAGHRKLAYISGRPDTSTNLDRMRGFSSLAESTAASPLSRTRRKLQLRSGL